MSNQPPRMVAYIMADAFVEGHGYRVAFVVEGENGYRPTGTWPYTGAIGETLPWFWGPTLADAEQRARAYNEKNGISADAERDIIVQSMFGKPAVPKRMSHSADAIQRRAKRSGA